MAAGRAGSAGAVGVECRAWTARRATPVGHVQEMTAHSSFREPWPAGSSERRARRWASHGRARARPQGPESALVGLAASARRLGDALRVESGGRVDETAMAARAHGQARVARCADSQHRPALLRSDRDRLTQIGADSSASRCSYSLRRGSCFSAHANPLANRQRTARPSERSDCRSPWPRASSQAASSLARWPPSSPRRSSRSPSASPITRAR